MHEAPVRATKEKLTDPSCSRESVKESSEGREAHSRDALDAVTWLTRGVSGADGAAPQVVRRETLLQGLWKVQAITSLSFFETV